MLRFLDSQRIKNFKNKRRISLTFKVVYVYQNGPLYYSSLYTPIYIKTLLMVCCMKSSTKASTPIATP